MTEMLYNWGGLNIWLFKLINGLCGSAAYGNAMLFITQFGDKLNFKYYFGAVLLVLLAEAGLKKMRGEAITRQHAKEAAALLITLVMGYAAYGFLIGAMKTIFGMPRPFTVPEIHDAMARGTLHFFGAAPPLTDYNVSFPSGHAATIAFIVTALWYKFNNRYAHYAGIGLVVLVCWSRIAIGMHFPVDLVGGAIIGGAIAFYVRRYVYRMMRVPLTPVAK